MAYYLSNERRDGVVEAYRKYQDYLRQHEREFPPNAFSLATAEWYQNPNDHRCPHDGWLENLVISEIAHEEEKRTTAIQIRLLAAHHDGYIEFFYPNVFAYKFDGPSCTGGLGDWLYDEFRLSSNGNMIHETEWSGLRDGRPRVGSSKHPMSNSSGSPNLFRPRIEGLFRDSENHILS